MTTSKSSAAPVNKLVTELVKYIGHSTHIAEHSKAYKENQSFMASLQYCRQTKRWLSSFKNAYPTKTVCREIVQNQGHFFNILPNPSNKSFEGSARTIHGIIEAAKQKIQTIN